MVIDLRDTSYPGLLEAIGLAIIRCDAMEQAIPSVFRAALGVSLEFQKEVFDATRGLEVYLKLTGAAVQEGAPAFFNRWKALATEIRSSAGQRGKVAHSGLSIRGPGIVIALDEDGTPTGVMRKEGGSIASLFKHTRQGREEIPEADIRELAERVSRIERDIRRLAADITVSKPAHPI